MANRRYLARDFQLAITGPLGPTQDAVFGIFVIVGVTSRLVNIVAPPHLSIIGDIPGWQVADFVLLSAFVIRLLVAMHWLQQEQSS